MVARIATSTLYSSSYITTADYRVLAAGVPRAVITRYAGLARQDLTFRWARDDWSVALDLFTRYNGELDVLATDMNTNLAELIDTIAKWPGLNGSTGVFRAQVRQVGAPQPPDPAMPHYGLQTVVVSIVETYDPVRVE